MSEWPRIEQESIPAVKDARGRLHAPPAEGSTVAVCGAIGEYVAFPANHTAIFCPDCLTTEQAAK